MEWQVEQGIGEERALLVARGEVLAARLHWPGELTPGQIEDAKLVWRPAGSRKGRLRFASGEEALIDQLPRDAAEGAPLRAIITRSRIVEAGRIKPAKARPTTQPLRAAPSLAEQLALAEQPEGAPMRLVRRFEAGLWDEVFAAGFTGDIAFAGGALVLCATPAMTVVDVDGALPLRELALAAVPALARAIGWLDLGGSIGIDFPTLQGKADRQALDVALAAALDHWPHERTAVNGFGFVQLVARMAGPSLLARFAADRAGAAARLLLRQAEGVDAPGVLLVTAPGAVLAACTPEWRAALARRTGRQVEWREDPALALTGGFAQAIAP